MLHKLAGWLGAALMVLTAFLSNWEGRQALAILGLALLTFQAYHLRVKNLLFLNLISIIGYLYSMLNGVGAL